MDILVVDGYNIIGAWDELKRLKEQDMGQARDRLVDFMAEYQAYTGKRVIVIFDAYFVPGKASKYDKYNLEIIFTKEKETADERIERLVKELMNVRTKVYVATSDLAEQRTIFGSGAFRVSARELLIEMQDIESDIAANLAEQQKVKPSSKIELDARVLEQFEKWRRGVK
ncbi:NYN domain-containing protein [Virgibacillus sp. 179-BFC.A HS]|uniref:NYN domain-containing protein n=1 Tax=Tigheibacillus jepli TaxID=3035914 RepID=A0ABU5CLT1_9BACI|nr:NYN domain-containing protein [Virgibacillus sp. 179-BFC.A HS]MDY0407304.1 NYN domain-containing protein [Virgibacillus sp. 179-BFC.A HS]